MAQKTARIGTLGLFASEERLDKISKQGDPLQQLDSVVDWELFRPIVDRMLNKDKMVGSGRRPLDPMLLFKILIIQRLYNLSDAQTEFQILDRFSFCRFLGLSTADNVPDEKTIWSFRNRLISKGLDRELFDFFERMLEKEGFIAQEGRMVDASFIKAPIQRNSREENNQIKKGSRPKSWNEKPAKDRQKDSDAKWTRKGGVNHYGYKIHGKSCTKSKFLITVKVSDASVHDSQMLDPLLDIADADQALYADSAYGGVKQQETLERHWMKDRVHEKGTRNRPMTKKQKASNTLKSKVRARVEHIFGFMEQSMHGLNLRSIGIERARGFVNITALVYNLFRYEQVCR
jgi:IS5 family transposase